jgi:Restriction endonuclease
MNAYVKVKLGALLAASVSATTSAARGSTLEDLVQHVFEHVPSVAIYERDVKDASGAQEVDLVLSHLQSVSRLPIPDVTIIVECKNERRKTSAPHVMAFGSKLRSRGLNIGILVTSAGLSGQRGTAAHSAIRDELRGGVSIIVVTAAELGDLNNPDDLVQLLTERLNELRTYRDYRSI